MIRVPDLDGTLNLPAIRRIERAGNMVRISVRGGEKDVEQRLAGFNPTSLRIVDRNLEDIFLDVVSEKG